jgi:methylmalonyl-CoA mutase
MSPQTTDRTPPGSQPATGAAVLTRDPMNTEFTADTAAAGSPDQARQPIAAPATDAQPTKLLQRLDDRSPERANRQALDDIAAGVDGFALVFEGAPNAFGHGLPASFEAMAAALRDVPLSGTHLRIDGHPASRASVDWLVRLLGARRAAPARLDVSFGIDPAAIFAGAGMLRMSIDALVASMPQSLSHYFALGLPGILLEADGRVFHNAGATHAQELAVMLASTVGYLRMFEEARQPALYAAAHVGFAMSVDQERTATAAKIAALRILWERLLERYAVAPLPLTVHAETSYRMLSLHDADANYARASLAALGAIEAGAATVSAIGSEALHRGADDGSRRRLRAALGVMAREGAIERVAAGSDLLAARVDGLCEAAWDELRLIEQEGGIMRSLEAGLVQGRILAAREEQALATGRQAAVFQGGRGARAGDGAAFCQRLDPFIWEERSAEAAA